MAEATPEASFAHQVKNSTTIAVVLINVGSDGTVRHAKELVTYWSERGNKVLLIHVMGRFACVTVHIQRVIEKRYICSNIDKVKAILKYYNVQLLHVEHMLDTLPVYLHLHELLRIPFVVTLHDYYTICPFIQLTYEDHNYCGEKGEFDCNECLARRKPYSRTFGKIITDIHEWRDFWYSYLKKADLVMVPSTDEKERLQHYFPDLEISVRENPEMVPYRSEKRQVGLIGSLSVAKGAQKIKEVLSYLAKRQESKIHFILFGTLQDVQLTQEEKRYITILGYYKEEQIYGQIASHRIDVFWFPAVWPETYSYTLSIPIRMGIPCLGTNLGAINSRIHEHHWGDTYPWNAGPSEIVQNLLNFPFENFEKENFVIENISFGTLDSYYGEPLIEKINAGERRQVKQQKPNIPNVFSSLEGTLVNNEFTMLWSCATVRQKVMLLQHLDMKWLKGVAKEKGMKYFLRRLREKI